MRKRSIKALFSIVLVLLALVWFGGGRKANAEEFSRPPGDACGLPDWDPSVASQAAAIGHQMILYAEKQAELRLAPKALPEEDVKKALVALQGVLSQARTKIFQDVTPEQRQALSSFADAFIKMQSSWTSDVATTLKEEIQQETIAEPSPKTLDLVRYLEACSGMNDYMVEMLLYRAQAIDIRFENSKKEHWPVGRQLASLKLYPKDLVSARKILFEKQQEN